MNMPTNFLLIFVVATVSALSALLAFALFKQLIDVIKGRRVTITGQCRGKTLEYDSRINRAILAHAALILAFCMIFILGAYMVHVLQPDFRFSGEKRTITYYVLPYDGDDASGK